MQDVIRLEGRQDFMNGLPHQFSRRFVQGRGVGGSNLEDAALAIHDDDDIGYRGKQGTQLSLGSGDRLLRPLAAGDIAIVQNDRPLAGLCR